MEIRKVLMGDPQIKQLIQYLDVLEEIFESFVYEHGNEYLIHIHLVRTLRFTINNGGHTAPYENKKRKLLMKETQVGLTFYLLDLLEQTLSYIKPKTIDQGIVIGSHFYKIIQLKDAISEYYAEGEVP